MVRPSGAMFATNLGHYGRLRYRGLDRRSAVENAGSNTDTKTDTSNPGTDEEKRLAHHRQHGGSLRAHSPLPPAVWSKAHASQAGQDSSETIFGANCDHRGDENLRAVGFSQCVAEIQRGPVPDRKSV